MDIWYLLGSAAQRTPVHRKPVQEQVWQQGHFIHA
jgi:hypothetical protein